MRVKKGTCRGKSLQLSGHVDVIPTGTLDSWSFDPWSGKVENGRLYGWGASNMKSGLAAMTMALKAVLESGAEPSSNVILEYTVDVELSGHGTLAYVIRGYRVDAGICCETSSMAVQPACIGRIWFEIDVRGKPAGIKRRWEGVNAIHKGYEIVLAVEELEGKRIATSRHPLYPDTREALPYIVCVFQSGTLPSAFPDSCILKGSLTILPNEDSEKIERQLVEHLAEAAGRDPWMMEHPPEVRFKSYFGEPQRYRSTTPSWSLCPRSSVRSRVRDQSNREGWAQLTHDS